MGSPRVRVSRFGDLPRPIEHDGRSAFGHAARKAESPRFEDGPPGRLLFLPLQPREAQSQEA
jgi:hypothetical protein